MPERNPPQPGVGLICPEAPLAMLSRVEHHGLIWDVDKGHWRNAKGQRICGAGPEREKGPCRAISLFGNGRCNSHGGPTPSGVACANYKHGRWSKVLSSRRSRKYLDAKEDPSLMDVTRPLAVMDGQVAEALERREALDTPDFRKRAVETCEGLRACLRNPEAADAALGRLEDLLSRGVQEDRARDEVDRRVQAFAKHNGDAWKIRLSAANAINQGDLTAVLAAIVQVVTQETPEELHGQILRRISREVLGGRLAVGSEDEAPG